MKIFILLVLVIASSTVFAQKLSKEELAVKMSEKSCECINKEEISKDNFELTLGHCIIEAINYFEKDVDRQY